MNNKFSKAFIYSGTKYFMMDFLMGLLPSVFSDIYMPTCGRFDWGQILRLHGVEKHIYASDINLWLMMAHLGIRDFHDGETIQQNEERSTGRATSHTRRDCFAARDSRQSQKINKFCCRM